MASKTNVIGQSVHVWTYEEAMSCYCEYPGLIQSASLPPASVYSWKLTAIRLTRSMSPSIVGKWNVLHVIIRFSELHVTWDSARRRKEVLSPITPKSSM